MHYPRPIVAGPDKLRPARETCEQCHWPEKFHGDKVRRIVEYADDEENTESVTTLRLHVGGGDGGRGPVRHPLAHERGERDRVYRDRCRAPGDPLRAADGPRRHGAEFLAPGVTPEQLAGGERRRMDCVDCHNRPSHAFAGSPDRAVNEVMARGASVTLPFVRREGVEALQGTPDARRRRLAEIAARCAGSIAPSSRRCRDAPADVEQAVLALRSYRRNVFPAMNVSWGTIQQHRAHGFPGLLPLPRRQPKAKDGKDRPGLRNLPRHRMI